AEALRTAVGRRGRARATGLVVGAALRRRRRRAVGTGVGGGRRAVGGQRRLADADLAVLAGIRALRDLRAARALGRIVEVGGRAGRRQQDRPGRARNHAATEAVTAVRHQLAAGVDAGHRLRRRRRALRRVRRGVVHVVGTLGVDARR